MIEKILHKYVVLSNKEKFVRKAESSWIDVSNLTLGQVADISKKMDAKYGDSWFVEMKRISTNK